MSVLGLDRGLILPAHSKNRLLLLRYLQHHIDAAYYILLAKHGRYSLENCHGSALRAMCQLPGEVTVHPLPEYIPPLQLPK